jgi:hypothetical protein
MKTLLERLKPRVMGLLDMEAEKYPSTIRLIKGELSQKYSITDISLGTVSDLSSIDGIKEFLQVNSFSEVYLIHNVAKLFDSAK